MTRRFGPTRGAGVAIIEKSGSQPIEPGALGFAGHGGVYERGNTGEMTLALDGLSFGAQMGGRTPDSLAPDAAQQYYNLANGAGGLLIVRVTDGNEVAANIPVYTRHDRRVQLGTLRAANGGRWGGKETYVTADMPNDVATDLDETTLDTGLTMTTDQYAGATLRLAGVANRTYTVVGNDDAGVLTVEADSEMNTDLTGGADPTNVRFYLTLVNGDRELMVEFRDGDENPTSEFGAFIYLTDADGTSLVGEYANLSTDPASNRYWVNVINDDSSNFYVEAVDLYTGSHVADARPANHAGVFTGLTATTMVATIHEFLVNSVGGGNPTMALGTTTDSHLAQTITLTMSDATNFTAVSDRFGALGSGVLGTEFVANNDWTPPFTVTAGASALAASDTLVVTYKPFTPDALEDGFLYPDVDSDRRLRYRIISNTHRIITVAAGSDMAADVTVDSGTAASGSITFVAQANMVDGETIVLDDGELPPVTFHINQSGGYTPGGGYDATNIEVDISGDTSAADVAGTFATALTGANINFSPGAVAATLPITADNVGDQANNAIIETVADAGFLVSGMSLGVDATEDHFRVQVPLSFTGGRNGNADLVDADYTLQLWDTGSSPFNRTTGKNLGLVKFATPGVTSTAVQRAGVAYAAARNHQYRYEVPENITTEAAVDAYINDTLGRSDYAVVSWPSRAYVADPDGGAGQKLVSLTGMIHGREASIARDWDGYHKAAAGETATLPAILRLPTGEAVLNEEFLNPLGINVIKKIKGNFVLWGDRTLWLTTEWKWKHQRELMSYYEHVLQEAFGFIVFAINDPDTDKQALVSLQSFFQPEWQPKRALRGAKFEQAAIIKVDGENNTDATRAAGDTFADVSLRLADTVERFVIRIGKQGIFESVA